MVPFFSRDRRIARKLEIYLSFSIAFRCIRRHIIMRTYNRYIYAWICIRFADECRRDALSVKTKSLREVSGVRSFVRSNARVCRYVHTSRVSMSRLLVRHPAYRGKRIVVRTAAGVNILDPAQRSNICRANVPARTSRVTLMKFTARHVNPNLDIGRCLESRTINKYARLGLVDS